MEANELMIGDWVLVNGSPMQIQAVNDIDGEIMAGDELYCLIEDRVHSEDKIEPILLTAEILEKNGLRKVTLDGEKGSKQDYYIDTHFVGYYNMDALTRVHASPIVYDIKQKWLFVDDKEECRIEMWCPYVHKLQHILKDGRIDKEMVL